MPPPRDGSDTRDPDDGSTVGQGSPCNRQNHSTSPPGNHPERSGTPIVCTVPTYPRAKPILLETHILNTYAPHNRRSKADSHALPQITFVSGQHQRPLLPIEKQKSLTSLMMTELPRDPLPKPLPSAPTVPPPPKDPKRDSTPGRRSSYTRKFAHQAPPGSRPWHMIATTPRSVIRGGAPSNPWEPPRQLLWPHGPTPPTKTPTLPIETLSSSVAGRPPETPQAKILPLVSTPPPPMPLQAPNPLYSKPPATVRTAPPPPPPLHPTDHDPPAAPPPTDRPPPTRMPPPPDVPPTYEPALPRSSHRTIPDPQPRRARLYPQEVDRPDTPRDPKPSAPQATHKAPLEALPHPRPPARIWTPEAVTGSPTDTCLGSVAPPPPPPPGPRPPPPAPPPRHPLLALFFSTLPPPPPSIPHAPPTHPPPSPPPPAPALPRAPTPVSDTLSSPPSSPTSPVSPPPPPPILAPRLGVFDQPIQAEKKTEN
ncbi:unnamed protein product [Dicrocoelium dendriticum]|nr:unnamed protein product [Dicrocoelium dendriticum]